MNKLANWVAALAVLLILGLPGLFGFITEKQLRARVTEISSSGVLTAQIRSFERGWFRGRAKIDLALAPEYLRRLRPADPSSSAAELAALAGRTAPLDVLLAFGPLAFLDGVHFSGSRMIATLDRDVPAVASLERALDVPYLFEFRGSTGPLGKLTFDADVPAVSLVTSSARVQFSGALLDGSLAGKRLAANARMDRLELTAQPGVLTIEHALVDLDHEVRSVYALPGEAHLSIGHVAMVDGQRRVGEDTVLDVNGLRVDATIGHDEATNLLDLQSTVTLAAATVEGESIADANAGFVLRNVDAAAVEAYATSARARGPSADPDAALRDLLSALERSLAAGPSFALDPLRFQFDGEPFTARVEVRTDTAALPPAGTIDVLDIGALLDVIEVSAELEVSKTLAQKLAALAMSAQLDSSALPSEQEKLFAEVQSGLVLVMLTSQGFLADAGNAYRSELRIADGAVTVNGTPLPFSVR